MSSKPNSPWVVSGESAVLKSLARNDQAIRTNLTTTRKLARRDASQGRTSGVLCNPWGAAIDSPYSHEQFLDFVKRSATWRGEKKQ